MLFKIRCDLFVNEGIEEKISKTFNMQTQTVCFLSLISVKLSETIRVMILY